MKCAIHKPEWEENTAMLEKTELTNMCMIRVFLKDDLIEFFYYPSGDGWSYALK